MNLSFIFCERKVQSKWISGSKKANELLSVKDE